MADERDTPEILMECPYCDGDGCTEGEDGIFYECWYCGGEGWC